MDNLRTDPLARVFASTDISMEVCGTGSSYLGHHEGGQIPAERVALDHFKNRCVIHCQKKHPTAMSQQ